MRDPEPHAAAGGEPGAKPAPRGLLARARARLADRRDPLLMDLSASGELVVARVRVLLLGILLVMQFVPGATADTRRVTLPLTLVAGVVAVLFYYLAARRSRPWLEGFASSAADVTLVSCGLAAFLVLDQPHLAVGSRTLFEVYFLAIGCASLRYNPQACALTGLLAVGQYATILLYAAARSGLDNPRYVPFRDGTLDWSVEGARLILLGAAALVSALIVLRAQGLRELLGTDRLTGVANRRAFDERLAEEAARAHRYRRPFTVALIDVDNFKRINDTYGHAGGDAVLRAVAAVVGRSMRDSDLVARLGGDEFALLMPETTAELVMDRLESLRDEVRTAPIAAASEKKTSPFNVTISIGVANWPDDGGRSHVVLASADARLYEAKRRGRDRIVGPLQTESPAVVGRPDSLPPACSRR